jgi:hypothetical protein
LRDQVLPRKPLRVRGITGTFTADITRRRLQQEDLMSKLLIVTLSISMFSAAALAMGPDPGGHTGAGVTPETTKTDRPEVDAARTAKSGGKVENNTPADPTQSKPSGKAKTAN